MQSANMDWRADKSDLRYTEDARKNSTLAPNICENSYKWFYVEYIPKKVALFICQKTFADYI